METASSALLTPGAAVGSPTREYIYSASTLVAKIEGGAVTYHHPDHLSNRVLTDSSGTVVGQQGHFPFGESWYSQSGSTKWKFTSYERDSESGNDYALMRTSINRLGRFSSPDPVAGSLFNPQSLNRYAYAFNDPMNVVDPLGLDPCENSTADWCVSVTGTPGSPGGPTGSDPVTGGLPGGGGGAGHPMHPPLIDDAPGGGGGDDPIGAALKRLKDLLKDDPKCLAFLNSKGLNALDMLNGILQFKLYGETAMLPTKDPNGTWTMTNAVSFAYPEQAITINRIGAFNGASVGPFNLTTDRGKIRGGTEPARLFILLHELGHNTNALRPDAHSQKAVNANDKDLEKNCKKTIKSFGRR